MRLVVVIVIVNGIDATIAVGFAHAGNNSKTGLSSEIICVRVDNRLSRLPKKKNLIPEKASHCL